MKIFIENNIVNQKQYHNIVFWVSYLHSWSKNVLSWMFKKQYCTSVLGHDRGWLHSGQEKNLFNVTVKLCHNSIFLWPPIHSSYVIPGEPIFNLPIFKISFQNVHTFKIFLIPRYHTILLLNYDHKFQNTHNFSSEECCV